MQSKIDNIYEIDVNNEDINERHQKETHGIRMSTQEENIIDEMRDNFRIFANGYD